MRGEDPWEGRPLAGKALAELSPELADCEARPPGAMTGGEAAVKLVLHREASIQPGPTACSDLLYEVERMQQVALTLTNAVGLHARPAALFVQTAARFRSNITVRNITRGTPAVNAKAILAVLTLGAEHGHIIEISAEGPDEEDAIATLKALVESRFGEDGG